MKMKLDIHCFLQDATFGSIQEAVNSIAERARDLAYDPTHMSPFAQHARENGMEFIGMFLKCIIVVLTILT